MVVGRTSPEEEGPVPDRSPQPRIQICQSSELARRPALLGRLRRVGASVEVVGCLDHCTLCHHRAVALVVGWEVFGRTPEELCDRILSRLQEMKRAEVAPNAGVPC